MVEFVALAFVFVAGLVTAIATGLGAIPFFLVDDVSDRWNVALWGIASGIMLSASLFGLIDEGLAESTGTPWLLALGLLAGVALVVVANRVLERVDVGGSRASTDGGEPVARDDDADDAQDDSIQHDDDDERNQGHHADDEHNHGHHADDDHGHGHDHGIDPAAFAEADVKKLVLILGVLTVHSFPEGVAVGVSFAELGLEGGVPILGLTVPVLAIFMTVAISIHNVPEGLAISIPLRAMDVGEWRMVGAAIFSSLPQPIGAVVAFAFVRWAREFLPFGFGFAAGAMVYLVLTEFVPEALEAGADLPGRGHRELAVGLVAGVAVMIPLLFVG
ncbi:ZIP family metal transporter [Halorubellus sp. JP-L1]|uniref:ZIP family metal transporter n=1 Tax=Halorubellus sp. JP-L1 TaxID=2715753 RepID=UPI00140D4589|nr:ZIP family metal transporter [Halorubellus sp. JP-L1]NHN43113.1 ZIP family metal transporter [Halorubellus sp. JP-L1]